MEDKIIRVEEMDPNKVYTLYIDCRGLSRVEVISSCRAIIESYKTRGITVLCVPSEEEGNFRIDIEEKD